ncbi:uncharacterized protein LOC117321913 [Pecten maximus]|uniref:uncharacterized protein LOC117321913 n=1 Tax=Pecten maximus TaxID=6579 RepID=UPI001458808F|nr:uncharacterized protein LOC117321913 [Pecten maximus]
MRSIAFNDQHPHLGYLLYGLLITIFVTEMLFVIMHVITIFAIRTLRKGLIYMSVVLMACMMICDIITLSLASLLNDKAGHNCEDTFYWLGFCDTQTSTVLLMTGLYIGFDVVHIACLCVLIGLGLHLSKNASPVTIVTPVDGLSGLNTVPLSNPVQSPARDNSVNASVANSTSDRLDRRVSVAQTNTVRKSSIAQSNTNRETPISQRGTGRRTSIAPSTRGRQLSRAEATTDRQSSVTPTVRSVDDVDNDDLETTYA